MVESTARFRVSPDVVTRDVPDGAMLVNIQTGAAFRLNRLGTDVWRKLDGARDVAAIVTGLGECHHVGAERLLSDVNALLEDLQKHELTILADRVSRTD